MDGTTRSAGSIFSVIAVTLALAVLLIPAVSIAVPDDSKNPGTVITISTLNVTNASLPNNSAPQEYQITREPVKIQAVVTGTVLPAPKGEMAAGPRTIGVSMDPILLAAGIIILVAAGIGVLLYIRRKPEEDKTE
jgi:hypothetical protein